GEHRRKSQQGLSEPGRENPGSAEQRRRHDSPDESFDGLAGTDRRRELAAAEAAPCEIGAYVGRPGDDERPHQKVEPVRVALPDPQQRKCRHERINEAGAVPRGTPSSGQPRPFIEHRRRDGGDEDGERGSTKHRSQYGQRNQDETGCRSDEEFVHRPPKRRSRAVKRSIASAKSRSEKSGHSFSRKMSSA